MFRLTVLLTSTIVTPLLTTCSQKKILATVRNSGQERVVHNPLSPPWQPQWDHAPHVITSKTRKSIQIYAKLFAQNTHFSKKAVNFPNSQAVLVNEKLNCNWLTESLDNIMANLRKFLSLLNFLSPPTRCPDIRVNSILNMTAAALAR